MTRKAILLASLVLAAAPAPVLAAGNYYVRNDTGRVLTCGLRREHGTIIDRFVLRAGAEWSQATEGDGTRVLLCDIGDILPHYRLRSGVRYAVAEVRGRFALGVIGPAR
jgi:hypothetical protein